MNKCQVFDPKHVRREYQVSALEFAGNRPAVPPLTTEMVTPVIYLVDEDEAKK